MKIFIPLTSSMEKLEFYRIFLEHYGVRVVPFAAVANKEKAPPIEAGHTRKENIGGKAEQMRITVEQLAGDEAKLFATLFYHLGYLKNDNTLEEVEKTLKNATLTDDQFWRSIIRPGYRAFARDLFEHPEEIVFGVDDSKLTVANVRFSNVYALAKNDSELSSESSVSDTQQAAAQALTAIIDESCAVIARKAWDKHVANNPRTKQNKDSFIEKKKTNLLTEIKKDNKEFPGAMAATFYEVAGGSAAFNRLLVAALGKNEKALLPIENASTINAVRLKRDSVAGKLSIEPVYNAEGSMDLRGKSSTPEFLRHPDEAAPLYPGEAITLPRCIVLSDGKTSLTSAMPKPLSKYGGRKEALQGCDLLNSSSTLPIPINQKNLPIAVIVKDDAAKQNAQEHAVVEYLEAQGHRVTVYTAAELLPEVRGEVFDPAVPADHGKAFYEAVVGHGSFVCLPSGEESDNLDMYALWMALLINTMIGDPGADKGKQGILVGDRNPIDAALKTAQEHGLAPSPLPHSHRTTVDAFSACFQKMLKNAPIRLGPSRTGIKPSNNSVLSNNNDSASLASPASPALEQPLVLSFCGSATCHEPKTLAIAEERMRGILDAAILQARKENRKILIVHGAGHDGLMGIFDKVAAEYAEKHPDLISVLGTTTPQLLETEAEGKPPTRGVFYNLLYLQRIGVVTAPWNVYLGPGGGGSIPYIPTFYVGTNRLTIISRMTEVNRRIDALKRLKMLKEDLDEGKSFFLDGEPYCL